MITNHKIISIYKNHKNTLRSAFKRSVTFDFTILNYIIAILILHQRNFVGDTANKQTPLYSFVDTVGNE